MSSPQQSDSASRSLNRRVIGAFLSIGTWALIVRATQAGKDLVVAHQFGTANALDAFLVAFAVPTFVTFAIAGPVGDALLPVFIAARERDRRDAQRLLSSVVVISVLGLVGVIAISLALAGPLLKLVGSGLMPATRAVANRFFWALMSSVLLSGLSVPWAAVLNASGRYRITTCTPLAAPLLTIALLATAGRSLGANALVIGMVGGAGVEAVVLGAAVRGLGWTLLPRWSGYDADVRRVVGQYAPLVAGSLLLSGTVIVDQSMAAMLGPHNVSALTYASKVPAALLSVANLAVGTPIMTNIAELAASGQWRLIRRAFWWYGCGLTILTLPATAALVTMSTPLVALLFQRGSFTAADTLVVGRVQACYLLQIPFHLLGVLAVRFLMAMSYNRALTFIAIIQLVINVVANYAFMKLFGLAGIALSTSLVFAVSMAIAIAIVVAILRERTSQG